MLHLNLFRLLSQEVSYADYSRNYALYIDGDIAKLPGGGRKGAAVLCELVPSQIQEPYDPYNDPRYRVTHLVRINLSIT